MSFNKFTMKSLINMFIKEDELMEEAEAVEASKKLEKLNELKILVVDAISICNSQNLSLSGINIARKTNLSFQDIKIVNKKFKLGISNFCLEDEHAFKMSKINIAISELVNSNKLLNTQKIYEQSGINPKSINSFKHIWLTDDVNEYNRILKISLHISEKKEDKNLFNSIKKTVLNERVCYSNLKFEDLKFNYIYSINLDIPRTEPDTAINIIDDTHNLIVAGIESTVTVKSYRSENKKNPLKNYYNKIVPTKKIKRFINKKTYLVLFGDINIHSQVLINF